MVTGVAGAALPGALHVLLSENRAPLGIVICSKLGASEGWAEELAFLNREFGDGKLETVLLPEVAGDVEDDPRAFDLQCDRLNALTRMAEYIDGGKESKSLIVFTTPRGFFTPVPSRERLEKQELSLKVGETLKYDTLTERLEAMGYDHEAVCETPGQYALRGGLVDIYPLNATAPVRVDFFGDEIDGLRQFDPTTQLTIETLNEVVVSSFGEMSGEVRERNILDYLGKRTDWFFHEPSDLGRVAEDLFSQFERAGSSRATFQTLFDDRERTPDRWFGIQEVETVDDLFGSAGERVELIAEPLEEFRTVDAEQALGIDRVAAEEASRRSLLECLQSWKDEGWSIVAVSQNEGDQSRLQSVLHEYAMESINPAYRIGPLRRGFRLGRSKGRKKRKANGTGGGGLVFVTTNDVFGRYRPRPGGMRRRLLPHRSQVDHLLDFSELAEGDPLVHLSHGICLYRGLSKLEGKDGKKKEEVISLEFDEGMILHLPLHESHLLTRYVGLTKRPPKLGKLGSGAWQKTRAAAEKATIDFASQLLRLQAERETGEGYPFPTDGEEQLAFEATFPFEETRDQKTAIATTKADMELPKPMDRLLCGDVGFGKTEVALRAAFKAVMGGKQVALLVPTTVLAQQHFNTFRERLAEFPVTVEMLSRFRTKQQQTEIVRQLSTGAIDIIVGTHRLLSSDIKMRDLGLLIIDEEHRFGVRHKERIKEMRGNVDVLAMSATPIPRTLYLALMGARDLSVIETAPVDRLPIQTIVKPYSIDLVKQAIRYELDRGGQVFYLHNRVQTIEAVADRLREELPDVKIGVGHGQMTEQTLERVMTRYVAGDYDVLVCTTIIESGLDIPNCNTIIIEGADRFGLSQLYQLRGRVGRFKRQAYAYLLLHRHAKILDQARKRLGAMRQYNQLGAGFRIAMRDLELRGAGNLIGAQQSGHIAGVGFELYCQLLRQSIARLKGEKTASLIRASVRLDFVLVGEGADRSGGDAAIGFETLKKLEREGGQIETITASLPTNYIRETKLRIDTYRDLAMCATPAQVHEVAASMRDRFGKPPPEAQALIAVTEIRTLAEQAGIGLVESEGSILRCTRAGRRRDDYVKIGNRFPRLTAQKPALRLQEIKNFLKRHSQERT